MRKLDVQIWSDIACPWCYVGKRRLETALAAFPHRDDVQVTWRAFELDPSAPRTHDPAVAYAQRLARKYGASLAQAETMIRRMTETAAADGLTFRFDRVRPGNTFDAHRVIHLGQVRGRQDAVKERLLCAYMTEGEAISDPEVLARLGGEAGLPPDDVRSVLQSGAYAEEVRADEREARALGVSGVPFFVVANRYGLAGAQPADLLGEVLARAWDELPEAPIADGAVCGPDGC